MFLLYCNFFTGTPKRVFWWIIILGCFGAVAYNVTLVFISFLSFDVDVDVTIVPNVELPFPSITVCNLTPINKQQLEASSGVGKLKSALGATKKKRRRKRSGININMVKIICLIFF